MHVMDVMDANCPKAHDLLEIDVLVENEMFIDHMRQKD